MTTINYNTTQMIGITETDYETVLAHLADQLGAKLGAYRADASGDEIKSASDVLTNTWQPELTAREWLATAGARMSVDTADCVGA